MILALFVSAYNIVNDDSHTPNTEKLLEVLKEILRTLLGSCWLPSAIYTEAASLITISLSVQGGCYFPRPCRLPLLRCVC